MSVASGEALSKYAYVPWVICCVRRIQICPAMVQSAKVRFQTGLRCVGHSCHQLQDLEVSTDRRWQFSHVQAVSRLSRGLSSQLTSRNSSIMEDGLVYFVLVFSTKFATTLNYHFNTQNPSLVVPVAASIGSIMCGRLLFNMHAGESPDR